MNRVKAQAAFLALYPLCIGFALLALVCRVKGDQICATDDWLDAADHEHQRCATGRGSA